MLEEMEALDAFLGVRKMVLFWPSTWVTSLSERKVGLWFSGTCSA